ncbi:hypothetical protein B4146_2176 [Bacillus subtilis]|uniref:Uncharacterized protein n=1 Tax=Bacillus subtilis TaxID=1423 RepID=A0AAP1HAD4_BACIU|nr:hypothetical protein B4146_2176 [Bacillus subtilis]KZD95376.1 hypothetical protein B4122_0348 [Bacillus subtilis]
MIQGFYKDQKLHLLEDPMQQYTVMKVEENAVCVYRWNDNYRHKIERFTDVEETKKLLGEGWPKKNLDKITALFKIKTKNKEM